MCGKTWSGGFVGVVMIEQAAEKGFAFDVFWRSRPSGIFVVKRDLVLDALMRTAGVVMRCDLLDDVFEMRLTDEDEVVECFARLPDKTFRKGITVRRLRRGFDNLYALGIEYLVEPRERGIVVVDEILDLGVKRVRCNEKISGLLADPCSVGVLGTACDTDAAGFVMDEEQYVESRESACGPDFLGEEVCCPGDIQMTADECLPVHAFAIGRGWQSVLLENIADRGGRYNVA